MKVSGFWGFMASFELISDFRPTGDQPDAIAALVAGFRSGKRFRTLEGVTGSGKTFTMANVIAQLGRSEEHRLNSSH